MNGGRGVVKKVAFIVLDDDWKGFHVKTKN